MKIKSGLYTYKNWLQCVEIVNVFHGYIYSLEYKSTKTGVYVRHDLTGTSEEEKWIKETFFYIGEI